MKKKTSKILLTSIMLVLSLSVMALLTGCGGTPTLEEYINDNKDEKAAMEAELEKSNAILAKSGMEAAIDIKENTIIYTYKMNQALNDDQIDATKKVLEQSSDAMAAQTKTLTEKLEKESKIEGISFRIIFVDKNDKEIYSKDFKNE